MKHKRTLKIFALIAPMLVVFLSVIESLFPPMRLHTHATMIDDGWQVSANAWMQVRGLRLSNYERGGWFGQWAATMEHSKGFRTITMEYSIFGLLHIRSYTIDAYAAPTVTESHFVFASKL